MKILHIITSLGNGGAEAILYRLILCNNTNTHVVVSLSGSDLYEQKLIDAGVEVHLLNLKESSLPLASLWKLHRIIRAHKPDIIQNWMYHSNLLGGVIARLSGSKNIFWGIHMSNPKLANLSRATQWVNRICSKLSPFIPSRIITCAHRATENHIAFGYDESKMITICNGYDLSTYKSDNVGRTSLRKTWSNVDNIVYLGTLARWHPVKDHEMMFQALSGLSAIKDTPWKLILAGPDMNTDNHQLVALLKKYRISEDCLLLDQINDVSAFMSALDVHILPSIDEGFPNVLAEAMACGTPCISTDCGDAAYIIGDTGWVGPIRDYESLRAHVTEAIEQTLDHDAWTIRTNAAIKRIHENFSIEFMSEEYNKAWKNQLTSSN